MANKSKNVAATVETIESKINGLNSISKGVESAMAEVQRNNDERAKKDAMRMIGESEYINNKTLIMLQTRRKQEAVTQTFLKKTKSIRDFIVGEADNKERDAEYFKKLQEKYPKPEEFTTTEYAKERNEIIKEYNKALEEIDDWKSEMTNKISNILRDYNIGLWDVSFEIRFQNLHKYQSMRAQSQNTMRDDYSWNRFCGIKTQAQPL